MQVIRGGDLPLLKICPMTIPTQQQAWMILVASEVYLHLDLLLMQLSSCELGELLQQSPWNKEHSDEYKWEGSVTNRNFKEDSLNDTVPYFVASEYHETRHNLCKKKKDTLFSGCICSETVLTHSHPSNLIHVYLQQYTCNWRGILCSTF